MLSESGDFLGLLLGGASSSALNLVLDFLFSGALGVEFLVLDHLAVLFDSLFMLGDFVRHELYNHAGRVLLVTS